MIPLSPAATYVVLPIDARGALKLSGPQSGSCRVRANQPTVWRHNLEWSVCFRCESSRTGHDAVWSVARAGEVGVLMAEDFGNGAAIAVREAACPVTAHWILRSGVKFIKKGCMPRTTSIGWDRACVALGSQMCSEDPRSAGPGVPVAGAAASTILCCRRRWRRRDKSCPSRSGSP